MDDPYIQRNAYSGNGEPLKGYSGNGTPLKGTVTKRMETQMQAAAMGIKTDGLSTREIRTAITVKQEADKDMADFIKETVAGLPRNQTPNAVQQEVTTTRTDDTPTSLINGSGKKGGAGSDKSQPIEFYCWKDGEVGTITLKASIGFTPLV
jgi:hypothetical protein